MVVGGVASKGLTTTLKLTVRTLPAASIAVTGSVVVPTGNVEPLTSAGTTGDPLNVVEIVVPPTTPLRKSEADTLKSTTAPALDVALACTPSSG